MTRVYGQSPTAASSNVKRYDELAGSTTQQDSNLARKQDVTQIGETLPIVFCRREGGDGGIWVSPRLVGIGFNGDYVNLAYILSEGRTGDVDVEEIWFGNRNAYDEFLDIEAEVSYESVASGYEIVNQPGKIATVEKFEFYSENPQVTVFHSKTDKCTGMEFVVYSTEAPFTLTVKVVDAGNGYVDVATKTLNFTGLTETQGFGGLAPSKYQFVLNIQDSATHKVVGSIETYQAGDGVTPLATYENMTLLCVKAWARDVFTDDFSNMPAQIHAFLRDGMHITDVRQPTLNTRPSSVYPNLVYYLMRNAIKLDDDLIDLGSMDLIANMNLKYGLLFNGVLNTTVSFQEWVFKTSPYFWASSTQIDGKYGLASVVPISADGTVKTDAVQPVQTIGLDDIIEGSYNMTMESSKERQDFCCVMIYKGSITKSISETKSIEVRFKEAALEGPFETHDITEFCIDINHAIRAAMYILSRRRYVTHTLSVTLKAQALQLNPGDIVNCDIEIEGGTKNKYYYQVDSISEAPDGLVSLALTHFPVNDQGQSLIALAITQELPEGEQQSGSSTPNSLSDNFVWR